MRTLNPPLRQLSEGSVVDVHGLKCVIETPQFTLRVGKDFINPSPAHYGYIKGFRGADGDDIDCYIGARPLSRLVYVIDQNRIWSPVFDEHKVMLCYGSKSEALKDYYFGHNAARRIFRAITTLHIDEFKYWLRHGNLKIPIEGTGYGRRPYVAPNQWRYFGSWR